MRRFIWTGLLLICLMTAAFAGWKLFGIYRTYQEGKEEYDKLTDYIDKDESNGNKDKVKGKDKCPIKVDFDALREINPDVVGWIYIPDTGINYPIVQAGNNTTYLHRTFQRKDSHVGAIFLDALCNPDFSSFNSIIYGHNLKNGEMFGHLKKLYDVVYNSKADYRKHPKVWIITSEQAMEYKIFAFREISINKDKDVYTINLSDVNERKKFFEDQIRKTQEKTGISSLENTGMITLSTCTSQTKDERFIVQALQ